MPLEVETKLRVPDELAMERLREDPDVLGLRMEEMRNVHMEAHYYDTPKDALNEKKWTFRIRKEDGESIGVFKRMKSAEDSVFIREEYSCPAETPEEAVTRLVALGAPRELYELSPFVERCRIEFTRTVCSLRLEEGTVCEFALDEGMIYAEEKSEILLELELELLCGPPEPMTTLARLLEERYALQKEHYSKYGRVLRLLRSRG